MPAAKTAEKGATSKTGVRGKAIQLAATTSQAAAARSDRPFEAVRTSRRPSQAARGGVEESEGGASSEVGRGQLRGPGQADRAGGHADERNSMLRGERISASPSNRAPSAFSPSPSRRLSLALARQPSLAAASSDSEISYAAAPVGAQPVLTQFALEGQAKRASAAAAQAAGRPHARSSHLDVLPPAFPRAASPFFATAAAAGPSAAQQGGLPPSAFALDQFHPQASLRLSGSLQPLGGTRSRSADAQLPSRFDLQPQPLGLNPLLDAFLEADRAVKENQPVRTRSRVEDWRERVAKTASVQESEVEVEDAVSYEALSEQDADADDDLSEPLSTVGQAKTKPAGHGPLSSLPAIRSSPSANASPPKTRKRRSPLPSQKPSNPAKKKLKKRPTTSAEHARSPSGSGSGGVDETLTTKDLLALLPKRQKVFDTNLRIRKDSDASADEGEEDDGEDRTDYELFPSSRHRRSTKSNKRARKPLYGTRKRSSTGGRRTQKREEESEDDSEKERRREAARKKWAAVDAFELETVLTL